MTETQTPAAFPDQLAAALAAANAAQKALVTANAQTEPLDADLADMLRAHNPARFAECERKVAEIAATIPALRDAYNLAWDSYKALTELACHYCQGTGNYSAPTSAYRQGKPYCFRCNGTGLNAKARKAQAK